MPAALATQGFQAADLPQEPGVVLQIVNGRLRIHVVE